MRTLRSVSMARGETGSHTKSHALLQPLLSWPNFCCEGLLNLCSPSYTRGKNTIKIPLVLKGQLNIADTEFPGFSGRDKTAGHTIHRSGFDYERVISDNLRRGSNSPSTQCLSFSLSSAGFLLLLHRTRYRQILLARHNGSNWLYHHATHRTMALHCLP